MGCIITSAGSGCFLGFPTSRTCPEHTAFNMKEQHLYSELLSLCLSTATRWRKLILTTCIHDLILCITIYILVNLPLTYLIIMWGITYVWPTSNKYSYFLDLLWSTITIVAVLDNWPQIRISTTTFALVFQLTCRAMCHSWYLIQQSDVYLVISFLQFRHLQALVCYPSHM